MHGLSGKNPQNDEEYIDEWKCNRTWIPLLLVENSRQSRSTAIAVESLRNEQVKGHEQFMDVIGSEPNIMRALK